MKLIDYFLKEDVYKNGTFSDLGYSGSQGNKILTFCDTVSYLNVALKNKNISAIIIKKELSKYLEDINIVVGIALDDNPREKFFNIYNQMRNQDLFPKNFKYGAESDSMVSSSAIVSSKSFIGHNTVISDNVIVKDNVFIGDNCFIDSGAILGNEGILYMQDNKKNNVFIKHAGIVEIGSNVTILSNAIVVKSVFQNMPTRIGDYSIIGISTTIGHEASIGKNCRVLGNCVVAKNALVGDDSIIGSSSVIRENIILGKKVDVKAGSIVIKNVKDGEVISGNFAIKHNLNVKNYFKSQK